MTEDTPGSSTSRRRYIKNVGGAAGIAALAGCSQDGGNGGDGGDGGTGGNGTATDSGDGGTGGDSYTFGYSPLYLADDWMTTWTKAGQWWAEDHGIELITANPGADPTKQYNQVQNMLQQGIDGLILSPADSQASAEIVQACDEEDVPVICSNSMSVSEKTKMLVAFDNYSAAEVCGQLAVEHLEEKYGEPRGHVLDVQGPQEMETLVQRSEGFQAQFEDYDDVTVHAIETNAQQEDAQTKVTNFLRSQDELDVVYALNPNAMLGAQSALEQFDMQVPKGNEDHVYSVLFAANPPIIDMIKDGFVDAALNQTPLFYGPIALHYMKEYLDAGRDESVFPEIGDRVTEDDLTIDGNERHGVDPWQKQIWAPANVIDVQESFSSAEGAYPYFQTSEVVVDESNVDEPWLWGNLAENYD